MSRHEKILQVILRGTSDSNVKFSDLCTVLNILGFECRIKGDHHIYFKEGIDEIINIQPKGNMAKPYQVKQVRNIVLKYKLEVKKNEI
ncbi:MAG: type II toxin-antitoxin system HicA family toxin [Spirochaetia bacterium]|nr:type II toxin-antitoxin system HicA family toxin [Spirochaetia bacterium]